MLLYLWVVLWLLFLRRTKAHTQTDVQVAGVSASFIALIKQREGFNQRVYRDSLGKPTAGTGHLLSAAENARYPVGTLVPMSVINQWFANDAGACGRISVKHCVVFYLILFCVIQVRRIVPV